MIAIVSSMMIVLLVFVAIFMYFNMEETSDEDSNKDSDEEEETKLYKPIAECSITGSSGSTIETFTQPNNMSILKSRNKEPFSLFDFTDLENVRFETDTFKSFKITIAFTITNNLETSIEEDNITYEVDSVMAIKIKFERKDTTSTPKSNYIIISSTTVDDPLPDSFTLKINDSGFSLFDVSDVESTTLQKQFGIVEESTEADENLTPENIWGIFAQDDETLDFITDLSGNDLSGQLQELTQTAKMYDEVRYKLTHEYKYSGSASASTSVEQNEVKILDNDGVVAVTQLKTLMTLNDYDFYYTTSLAAGIVTAEFTTQTSSVAAAAAGSGGGAVEGTKLYLIGQKNSDKKSNQDVFLVGYNNKELVQLGNKIGQNNIYNMFDNNNEFVINTDLQNRIKEHKAIFTRANNDIIEVVGEKNQQYKIEIIEKHKKIIKIKRKNDRNIPGIFADGLFYLLEV